VLQRRLTSTEGITLDWLAALFRNFCLGDTSQPVVGCWLLVVSLQWLNEAGISPSGLEKGHHSPAPCLGGGGASRGAGGGAGAAGARGEPTKEGNLLNPDVRRLVGRSSGNAPGKEAGFECRVNKVEAVFIYHDVTSDLPAWPSTQVEGVLKKR